MAGLACFRFDAKVKMASQSQQILNLNQRLFLTCDVAPFGREASFLASSPKTCSSRATPALEPNEAKPRPSSTANAKLESTQRILSSIE